MTQHEALHSPVLETVWNLAHRGVRFSSNGDRIRVTPWSEVTEAERDALRAHREAVLVLTAMLNATDDSHLRSGRIH